MTSASGLAVRALVRNQSAGEAASHLSALLRAQRRIVGALPDSVTVATAVVNEARELTSADVAVLELVDGSELVCHAASGDGAPAVGSRSALDGGLAARAFRTGEVVAFDDADRTSSTTQRAVPLSYRGRVIGVVTVRSTGAPFAPPDVQTLQILGGVAAYAVGCSLEYDLRERMASLGRLAAGMGHEINNPLAYVTANISYVLELLDESGPSALDGDGVRQALQDAQRGASRIASVVAQLRAFSRGGPDARHPVDLEQVLRHSARMASHEIRHRARLVESYDAAPLVFGNEVQLGQVFLNMLVNAGQAIPAGREGARVEIRLARSPEGGAVIEISDTGDGIAPEDLVRIFDPFFTTKPVGVGTGLGLSISYGIVRAHGGDITVRSDVGAGTRFCVTLPPAPKDAPLPPKESISGRYRTARSRVLVIDDEPAMCASLQRLLSRYYDVETCGSPTLALGELLSGTPGYDVILCDAMMPGLSGADLHRAVARERPDVAARFVFLTGGAFEDDTDEYLAATGSPRLEKPCDVARLRDAVDAAAGAAGANRRA